MQNQRKDESIKLYCSTEWKHKIKQLPSYSNESISNYLIKLIAQQLENEITPSIDFSQISKKIENLELLILTLFRGLYDFNNQSNIFEEICSAYYRRKNLHHE